MGIAHGRRADCPRYQGNKYSIKPRGKGFLILGEDVFGSKSVYNSKIHTHTHI